MVLGGRRSSPDNRQHTSNEHMEPTNFTLRNGPRKAHSKSRRGCGQCKRRHVRCDLKAPICSNCRRRQDLCDYIRISNYQPTKEPSQKLHVVLARLPVCVHLTQDVPPSNGCLWLLKQTPILPRLSSSEMECLATELQQHIMPNFGYLEPSIASLWEMYRWVNSNRGLLNAYLSAHQRSIEASACFRSTEYDINQNNWLPILMFGIVTVLFELARSCVTIDSDHLAVFKVLRGAGTLVSKLQPWLQRSPLKCLLDYRLGLLQYRPNTKAEQTVQRLRSLILCSNATGDNWACINAAERLVKLILDADGHPRSWNHFIEWPARVHPEYVELLEGEDPLALLVFVHWCTVMCQAPTRWLLDGWAPKSIRGSTSKFGPEWKVLLE